MKWKSVSPDVKRRDSFKLLQSPQNFNYKPSKLNPDHYLAYANDDESVDSIMRKFQELERMEREQKENNRLEFERQVREKRYQQSQNIGKVTDYNIEIDKYRAKDQNYLGDSSDQRYDTNEYNHFNGNGNGNGNGNEHYYRGYHQNNQHNQQDQNPQNAPNYYQYDQKIQNPINEFYLKELKRRTDFQDIEIQSDTLKFEGQGRENKWLTDDEDENELYFFSGKRTKSKSTNKKIVGVKFKEPEGDEVYNQEYFSEDFDSDRSVSLSAASSWSDSDEELSEKYSENIKKNSISKLKTVHASSNSINRPKAYAPKFVDIDAPTLIKIPPNPIPGTWAHLIHNPLNYLENGGEGCKEILTSLILNENWLNGLKLKCPIQGIYMRPPFNKEFTAHHWAKFMQRVLPVVMDGGYLFVWVEREELAGVIRAADRFLSFKYVENLCWIRRSLGNRLMREPLENGKPALFCKSKLTLLILRRDPKNQCKLRHQRNPDCIFDFVGPGRMPDGRVYEVIETLLDGTKANGPHLMHLWAGSSPTDRLVYQARKHWIRVIETDEIKVEFDDLEKEKMEILDQSKIETELSNFGESQMNKNECLSHLESYVSSCNSDSDNSFHKIKNEIEELVSSEPFHEEQKFNIETEFETDLVPDPPDYISNLQVDFELTFDSSSTHTEMEIPMTINTAKDEESIEREDNEKKVVDISNIFEQDFCDFIAAEPIFSHQLT